ncbi:rod-binding protein [Paracoccus contaminans]|uniref:Flagellar protein FlgJ N-terminal domain-containing protein n=1 Tax=Paracoccus contaminans TaxID=1945662 RepID=A0A1W6CY84_9RHOB|nr:rod-binding protein [Paracoccus contaminans]ARJ69822.1 hypothetical protein B0A89_09510 [Paracoccus contaminans]
MKIDHRPEIGTRNVPLSKGGERLEAAFLGEMLKLVMPDGSAGAFGGGAGESQFASFLTEQYADALAERLDLGLAARMGHANA